MSNSSHTACLLLIRGSTLMKAVGSKYKDEVVQLLLDANADVEGKNSDGYYEGPMLALSFLYNLTSGLPGIDLDH